MKAQTSKTYTRDSKPTHLSYYLPVVLSLVALLLCYPAVSNATSFTSSGSVTVSFGNLSNVSYDYHSIFWSPWNSITVTGKAGASFDSNKQKVTWNNGQVTFLSAPASGWAAQPGGSVSIGQLFQSEIDVSNSSNVGVEVPITTTIAAYGSVVGDLQSTWTSLISEVSASDGSIYQSMWCNDGTLYCDNGSGITVTGPITLTSDLWVPAFSEESIYADAIVSDQATATTPEPGTFMLLGSGLLIVTASVRRRVCSAQRTAFSASMPLAGMVLKPLGVGAGI